MEPIRFPLKGTALAAAGVVAIEAFARWAADRLDLSPLPVTGAARLAGIAWMALIVSGLPGGWARVGLGRGMLWSGLAGGLVWTAGLGMLAALGWGALHTVGIDPLKLLQPPPGFRPPAPALLFLVGGLIGPAAEELFFRGMVYGGLRRFGFWPALLASTLVFTLLHAGAPALAVPQAVGGLAFAVAYETEKKLLAPLTIHVVGNLVLFSLL